MPTDEKILDCYEWRPGACFRCACTGVDTTVIGRIVPRSGEEYEVRACKGCTLRLERERRRAVEHNGEPYIPGQLGRREL